MKNVRSVQVTLEQIPHLQGNKPGKAEWGQSNPAHKSTGSYSLSVKPFCGSRNFLPDQGTQAGYGPYSLCEIQLTPPPRGTSENKLTTRTREEDQCALSISELWPGCSQQLTSPFPLCQTPDALLVEHGSEPHLHLSTPVASVPSTAWQVDTLQGTTRLWYEPNR